MEYKPHQIQKAKEAYKILKSKGYVYIAGKPRSGKTGTAIALAEMTKIDSWLILTKKQAIEGIQEQTDKFRTEKRYHVTNYEQVHKLHKQDYGGVIIDESHNYGAFPKISKRLKQTRVLCWEYPRIHLSGTAVVESPSSIYHQMTISKYMPFKFKNFYDFHRHWGIPYYIKMGTNKINQYDKTKPELLAEIDKFTIYITQEDAGIDSKYQAVDKVHYVELLPETKKLYNQLLKDKVAKIGDRTVVLDSDMKERISLHMLEGGILKDDTNQFFYVGNTEKIDYVKELFHDVPSTGIMCHFIEERRLVRLKLPNVSIYSSNAHAEGVDLSHLNNFIILSSDYSGSKFIQRRERIVNMNSTKKATVHHILVRGGISEQVYKAVSKKQDFNNKAYERSTI